MSEIREIPAMQLQGNNSAVTIGTYTNDPTNLGRFLFDLDNYPSNSIASIKPYRKPFSNKYGTFFYDEYTMDDGVKHRLMEGVPHIQLTSIPVDSTTAWFTQPEGHNAITDSALMALGFRTRRLGPERYTQQVAEANTNTIDFLYLAQNHITILDAADEIRSYGLTKGISLYTGESRGAMIEPALQLLATALGSRVIAHSDVIDPCCPEAVDFSDLAKLGKVALSEIEAITRTALHIIKSPNRRDYTKTIDITPECLIPAIYAASYLLNGQAGLLAEQRSHISSPMNITFMRRSFAAEQELFYDIYKNQTAVNIQQRSGSHLDIPRTLRGVTRRKKRILEQLQKNGDDPTNLDLDIIYERNPPKRKLWLVK